MLVLAHRNLAANSVHFRRKVLAQCSCCSVFLERTMGPYRMSMGVLRFFHRRSMGERVRQQSRITRTEKEPIEGTLADLFAAHGFHARHQLMRAIPLRRASRTQSSCYSLRRAKAGSMRAARRDGK